MEKTTHFEYSNDAPKGVLCNLCLQTENSKQHTIRIFSKIISLAWNGFFMPVNILEDTLEPVYGEYTARTGE